MPAMGEGADSALVSVLGKCPSPQPLWGQSSPQGQAAFSPHIASPCTPPRPLPLHPWKLLHGDPRAFLSLLYRLNSRSSWWSVPCANIQKGVRLPAAQLPRNCLGPGSNWSLCLPSSGSERKRPPHPQASRPHPLHCGFSGHGF